MNIIDNFITQYNKEYDYYQKLSQIISNKIEDQLFKRGIKAIVSFRAKKPERLYDKLISRNKKKKYQSLSEIFDDIVDLAGIRVSLYFPSERELLDEIVNEIFDVKLKKDFPNDTHVPKHNKRFSGYWATHYRVQLKDHSLTKRYQNTLAEVQVASVLMHAWSEVEHDLVYKPYSGDLSKEELSILDEINGLVLAGEIALERLQSAMAIRTEKSAKIDDKYELTNYIINKFKNKENVKYGNTFLINNFLKTNKNIDTKILDEYLNLINLEDKESISNQLLDIYMNDSSLIDKNIIKKYLENLNLPHDNSSIFEKFIKCWSILDETASYLINDGNINPPIRNKYHGTKFELLYSQKFINKEQLNDILRLRTLRNELVHNLKVPNILLNDFEIIKEITNQLINKISVSNDRKKLEKEMRKL
ncbi:GTP pyrophosphokinase family protein [Leeuwenhoekiella sp. A16]|uniref:GTP pyrophosphokinase n=1 Tax=Leeuwenhoekiella sp. A16 TaxID=3141462 RepID=UPI003A808E50